MTLRMDINVEAGLCKNPEGFRLWDRYFFVLLPENMMQELTTDRQAKSHFTINCAVNLPAYMAPGRTVLRVPVGRLYPDLDQLFRADVHVVLDGEAATESTIYIQFDVVKRSSTWPLLSLEDNVSYVARVPFRDVHGEITGVFPVGEPIVLTDKISPDSPPTESIDRIMSAEATPTPRPKVNRVIGLHRANALHGRIRRTHSSYWAWANGPFPEPLKTPQPAKWRETFAKLFRRFSSGL